MPKKRFITIGILSSIFVSGCQFENPLSILEALYTLGAIPSQNFSNSSSDDFGVVQLSIGGSRIMNSPFVPLVDLLEIESDQSIVHIESTERVNGNDSGELLMLVDGSGSLENYGCSSCPTDPDRYRVEAVQLLSKTLQECSSDWRIGLSSFGTERISTGYSYTEVLVDYTNETQELMEAADGLDSIGGTPLWDSVYENLNRFQDEVQKYDTEYSYQSRGQGLIVVSDGEDTDSLTSTVEVISRAQEMGIPVSIVALGASSDLEEDYSKYAIEELREVAHNTGGFYATVSSVEDLPHLARDVAGAYCGGYQNLTIKFDTPPTSGEIVEGNIKVLGTSLLSPFSFRAP